MPAEKISLEHAKEQQLFYFVANVVVCRKSDGRCLILKRSKNEKVHPGKYGVIGGKLEWKDLDIKNPTRIHGEVLDYQDAVEKLLAREAKEEAGIEIDSKLFYINSVGFIRTDGVPSILVKFAATYKSGDVVLEQEGFDDFAWVNAHEAREYDCLEGIPEEIVRAIELLNKDS